MKKKQCPYDSSELRFSRLAHHAHLHPKLSQTRLEEYVDDEHRRFHIRVSYQEISWSCEQDDRR